MAQGLFSIGVAAHVPPTWPAASPATFTVVPTATNNAALVTFDWDFGGGTVNSGSSVTVVATANAGYAFVNWTENGTPVSTIDPVHGWRTRKNC